MVKNNRFVFIMMYIMIVALLAACSGGNNTPGNQATGSNPPSVAPTESGSSDEDPPAPETPVTIRLVVWGPELWTKTIPEKFNEKYPHITLQVEKIDGGDNASVLEKITALSAAGTPADLTWVPGIPDFMKDDLLLDLTPYMQSDPVLSTAELSQPVKDALSWKGKLVALPRAVDAHVMFVNKDLLAKHGIDMPSKDWTWDEFREIAKQATDATAGEYGLAPGPFNYMTTPQVYAVSNGLAPNLNFMNEDWTQSLIADPNVLSAVQWYAELGWVDGSRPSEKQSQDAGIDPNGWGSWLSGKIAFDIMGTWEGTARKAGAQFDWDVIPFPRGSQSQVGYNAISPIGILNGTKNADAAAKFLSWLLSPDGQRVLMSDGNIPLTTDPALWEEVQQTGSWAGKSIKDAVQADSWIRTMPGEDKYIQWWAGETGGLFNNGGDLSVFQKWGEEFNANSPNVRKELGLE
ncbi:ABC transporter substrate-binding protein [Paenibacillus agaridevorans]|uniref:ABC transporter substrate-binding protein n=1 Tax=Paenibacillus agaridevorans TaxID=171404 RepID=UPI001BE41F85|nr:sugar ABC transporter substrate-binding protein [Paenibacillus agaridevorans]